MNYSIPVWDTLSPWIKFDLFNAFNNDKQIASNVAVALDPNSPVDALGIPTGYTEGPNFGEAKAFVFGSAVGERTKSVKTAWETVCRKTGTSDLHFHDLRHEAGSRFLEAGWPLHEVQYMLGHADIKTTSTYLNVTLPSLHQSMRRLDEARQACTNLAQTPSTGRSHPLLEGRQKPRNTLTS